MIATVGALILTVALLAGLSGAVWHQRSRARQAEEETRRLRVMVGQTAHLAAWALRGQPAQPLPEPRPQRSRHLRAVQGVLWPAALAGLVEAARRHPARVGAALAATTLAGLVALPLLAPGDPQPSRPEPPPVAAAPPVVRFPDPPELEPTPELEPGPEAGVPGPAPAEQPEMQRVAVVQSEPSLPEPPVDQPQPEPVPVPAPAPEPSPEPPAPSPAPPPEPEPDPDPPPPEDGGDDPALLCIKLLRLPELCLP